METRQAPSITLAELRTRIDAVLQPQRSMVTIKVPALESARLLLAYAYGLAQHELGEATLGELDTRAGVLLDELLDEDDGLGDELRRRCRSRTHGGSHGPTASVKGGHDWSWIEDVYRDKDDGGQGHDQAWALDEAVRSSQALHDLVSNGRHIRPSLHPFNLYRLVFHDLDRRAATCLLWTLKTVHMGQTRALLSFGASFASPQWSLLTSSSSPTTTTPKSSTNDSQRRADLESLCAELLERAHNDTTPVRARFRLVSQALVLAPPDQLRALLPQWTLVAQEAEEALQGADPYADAATAAADAARGFGAGLGLSGALSHLDIGELGAGVRSWGASVGRMVGVWR